MKLLLLSVIFIVFCVHFHECRSVVFNLFGAQAIRGGPEARRGGSGPVKGQPMRRFLGRISSADGEYWPDMDPGFTRTTPHLPNINDFTDIGWTPRPTTHDIDPGFCRFPWCSKPRKPVPMD